MRYERHRGHGKSHFGAALAQRLREGLPRARVHLVRAREPVQGDPSSTLRMLLRQALQDFTRDESISAEQGFPFWKALGMMSRGTGHMVAGRSVGMLQDYRVGDHPDYALLTAKPDAAALDYLIGDQLA